MSIREVILGLLPSGGMGLRVARPGFDANDPNLTGNQLAFDSRFSRGGNLLAYGHLAGGETLDLSGYTDPPYVMWVEKTNANEYWSYRSAFDVTSGPVLAQNHPGGFYILWR